MISKTILGINKMRSLWLVVVLALCTSYVTFNPDFSRVFTSTMENLYTPKPITYSCTYAGMWCSCYSNNQGGCSVGCSPNTYLVLHNQTHCPQYSNFILAGFTVS